MWKDRVLTAAVPMIWGSTYIVTTEMLPGGYPLTVAMLRALPAGLILLLVVRRLPPAEWLVRLFVLGGLNFTLFWAALFIAAYRLPGGLAATLGASQPLIVLFLARTMLGTRLQPSALVAALAGIVGVALLILGQQTDLDPIGVAAALTGAFSMGAGTVLTRKWQPPVSALTFAAWQLTAGGLLLLPIALFFEPGFPMPSTLNLAGLVWLGLIGAALTYFYWFRGIARLGPAAVAAFGFLSPLTAVLLGWAVLGQALSLTQILGATIVILSVWLAQRAGRHELVSSAHQAARA
ncbi:MULTISPECIES: EamA family transporter [unclassified Rhizobium]|uniref:EamA family transporter n=1 Tax=Rhizobium sp. PP-CC-3G-465 TaxID=2135648 RepID=UPI000D90065E|nr:putative blue pigment (indigoidine) exporter [Rhizobium sp. PP-F2F-G20b]TCQ14993.1 putative blue pigment (indigoidine) exporter [Rhizobium sp. PP-CC-3G-465]